MVEKELNLARRAEQKVQVTACDGAPKKLLTDQSRLLTGASPSYSANCCRAIYYETDIRLVQLIREKPRHAVPRVRAVRDKED